MVREIKSDVFMKESKSNGISFNYSERFTASLLIMQLFCLFFVFGLIQTVFFGFKFLKCVLPKQIQFSFSIPIKFEASTGWDLRVR